MSQRSAGTVISEGTIFIRDNIPGTKVSDPVVAQPALFLIFRYISLALCSLCCYSKQQIKL